MQQEPSQTCSSTYTTYIKPKCDFKKHDLSRTYIKRFSFALCIQLFSVQEDVRQFCKT